MDRDFKGVWVPKEIWLDKELGWTEKMLLVEIDSLSNLGECFATNEYFGEFFNLSKDRISKVISSLIKKHYIESKLTYKKSTKQIEKRVITTIGYMSKHLGGIGENNYRGIGENNEDNNTSLNKTTNKTIIKVLTPLEKTIKDFKDMRKTIKKPLTTRALEIMLKKLDGLADTEDKKILILEQSIMSCYQGIFPLKEETNGGYKQNNKPSSSSEYDFSKYTG